MDDFPEEVHDETKKGKRALNPKNVEKAEQAVQEEKTFEETMEFWKEKAKKAEQAEKSIEQELKAEDDTFEEYGFEQADLAEYVADLEAEIKAGKPEEKIYKISFYKKW